MGFQFKDDKGNIVEQPGIYNMPQPVAPRFTTDVKQWKEEMSKEPDYPTDLSAAQYEAIIKQIYAEWANEIQVRDAMIKKREDTIEALKKMI